MTIIRRHLASPAMVVACAALIVALGGVSYAASVLPKNSVGARQLKKKAVSRAKLKKDAVTTDKVKNGSLLAADFKAGQLPAGPSGPAGPQGPKGDKGNPGVARVTARQSPYVDIPANSIGDADVQCGPGELATGGGPVALATGVFMRTSSPLGDTTAPSGWHVRVNNTTATTQSISAVVVCAKTD